MGLNVTIDDDLARYVQAKVDAGQFSSPREVIENALRILASLEATDELIDNLTPEKSRWLRTAWDEGIESGDAGPPDIEEIKREARRRFEAEK
ncbi:MAG TPA: type II toxin-antitoxin system ParD family antitoxin [Beijerinckiaceae bacterium]|nr:type II toxin-antitoxin system ParD family antitoxin [Beijerinckiaceae bacterium]